LFKLLKNSATIVIEACCDVCRLPRGDFMDEFVKVLLYRGEAAPEGAEIKRDEFEKALDMLFNSEDEGDFEIVVNGKEVSGVTDIVLAGALEEREDEVELLDESFGLAA
jgi:hypothetical protein